MIGGVVGGFAEYLGINPTLARVIYVLLSCSTIIMPVVQFAFPGIVVYLICWFAIPVERIT